MSDLKFSEEEINFLLERINNLEDSSITKDQQLLKDFLIKQLIKFKKINSQNNRLPSKAEEETSLKSNKLLIKRDSKLNSINSFNKNKLTLKQLLKKRVGQFIVINIKSGEECCQLKGVLCNVGEDMINLVTKEELISVKLEAIIVVKNKLNKFESCTNYYQDQSVEKGYNHQECFTHKKGSKENEPVKEFNDNNIGFTKEDCLENKNIQVNKMKVTYTQIEE